MPIPQYPILFYKPSTSLSDPTAPIPVSRMAQLAPGLDYECELVIVIGKSGSNIPRSNALKHVLGYSIGNDVSHREWQLKRGGSQWSLGKGFDAWAPWGPAIVVPEALPSGKGAEGASGLEIWTKLNGQEVQKSDTSDLIFGVEETVSFLSQGTTLMPGDIIFTGT